MNKLILFSAVLFLTGPFVFSQHELTSDNSRMRAGDEIVKQQVAYKDPGRAGENVLWDFSQLTPVNDQYPLSYFEARNGKLAGLEHGTLYYYSLSNDSLLLWGYKNSTAQLSNDLPELLLTYPCTYGQRHANYFYGRGLYCDRMEMELQGTILSEADASGMLVLPDKDTLRNVLRTRTLKYISEEMQPIAADYYFRRDSVKPLIISDSIDYKLANDSIVYALETFRWYARGYRYPVFETVRSWTRQLDGSETTHFGTAFFYPPEEHSYLEEDSVNLALLEEEPNENPAGAPNPWTGLTYNFYPNPVETDLEIEIYMPKQAGQVKMQLTDRMGKIVWKEDFGQWPEGINTARVLMSPYVKGEYALNMWFDEYLIVGAIVMKK